MDKFVRPFSFLLFLLLLASLFTACGTPSEGSGIVVSNFICYDFVRAIAGDAVPVTMLLPAGSDPHRYDPSIQDILALCNAELFVYGGGESDAWAEKILADRPPKRIFALMEQVEPLEEESPADSDGHSHTHAEHDHDHESDPDHGEETAEYDEHVWTSPKNALAITAALTEELAACYPESADRFRANGAAYCEKLAELDIAFTEAVARGSRDLLVFGDRFPLLYLFRAYGLRCEAAFSGCASKTEADPATIRRLMDTVTQEKIPVVFTIELSSGTVADAICEATGAAKRTFYACHTVAKEDLQASKTYLDFMYHNLAVLQEALAPCPN